MGKLLIVIGLVIAGVGVLIQLGLPIGRLPGDIVIRREHSTFYFPIMTSIVISVILTLAAMLFRR
jgi:uncharacterized membrane protein YczE